MISKNNILGVAILISISALCHGYEDCGSTNGEIIDVSISGCNDNETCELQKNTTVTVEITFKALADSETLYAAVVGYLFGNPSSSITILITDACEDSGITCPIENEQTYEYVKELVISQYYPKIPLTIKYELKTEDGEDAVCVQIPAKIV